MLNSGVVEGLRGPEEHLPLPNSPQPTPPTYSLPISIDGWGSGVMFLYTIAPCPLEPTLALPLTLLLPMPLPLFLLLHHPHSHFPHPHHHYDSHPQYLPLCTNVVAVKSFPEGLVAFGGASDTCKGTACASSAQILFILAIYSCSFRALLCLDLAFSSPLFSMLLPKPFEPFHGHQLTPFFS